MKKQVKKIAFFLAICMTLSVFAGFVPAFAAEQPEQTDDGVQESFALPDIVSMEEAQEHGYVGRVKEEESDLYTMVFRNEDGTNTMRVYSHPVKYMDVNGEVKDISLDVAAKADGSFVSASHDIQTTFRRKLTDGITLAYDDIEVTLLPKAATGIRNPTASVSSDRKTVAYTLDERTSYEYSLTYTGFKEDIVVTEYTGQTDYEFRLYTGGLAVSEQCDSYFLVDEDGNIKAAIGDIIVFTADERNNTMGSLFCETVVENEEYLLTIHLDREYLADERTAYPIRIDPTIEINYEKDGDGAIEDVTINSLRGSAGSSSSMYVGRRDTYGISRTLMKFPGLDLSGVASASSITSTRVEIRDILCESEALTVYCHVFNGDWEEDTASWDTVSYENYNSTALDEQTISYALGVKLDPRHRYSFDITSAVKTWKTNATAKNRGIIFKASSDVEYGNTLIKKTFASYNRSSNQPSLTVEYEETYSISLDCNSVSLYKGNTATLCANTYPNNATVSWESSNSLVATVSSSGVVTAVGIGNATITATANGASVPCEVHVILQDGVYSLRNAGSKSFATISSINLFTSQYPYYLNSSSATVEQYWRIAYNTTEKAYEIQPYLNSNRKLAYNSYDGVYFTSDALAFNETLWDFSVESYQTSIRPHNTNGIALGTTVSEVNYDRLIVVPYDSSSSASPQRWTFTKISTLPTGIIWQASDDNACKTTTSTSRLMKVGESVTIRSCTTRRKSQLH